MVPANPNVLLGSAAAKPVQMLSDTGNVEVLPQQMADGSVVVGMVNRGDAAASGSFAWSASPLAKGKTMPAVRDLWKHEAVTVSGDSFSAIIPSHGVVMLRASSK